MRKALLGLIMAATVMSPIAAQAQEWRGARGDRAGRAPSEQRQASSERRAERAETRSERQESRQEVRTERRAARQQARQSTRQDVRTERRSVRQSNRQVQPAAVAQTQRGDRRGDRRRDAGPRQSAYPQSWQGNPNDPRRQRYEDLERRNQYRYGTRQQREQVRREWRDDRRGDRRDWRDDRRADRRDWRRDWDRRSWRNDRRYDWRNWRYRNRSHYRLSRYYSPYRNYGYSRFSIGLFLQPLFYNQRYWINDPWSYRLPYAPAGTQWVRYYNDVILVDVYSGEVIDVIYDFFW